MEAQAKAPPELKAVANFLRNKSGMKIRTGVLSGKRVDYFKGRSAIKALLSPAYAKLKGVPKVTDEASANALLHLLIPHTFYLRVERGQSVSGPGGPKLVQITSQQLFAPDEYYVWLMDANPLRQLLLAAAMVAVVLAAVMFPLWPAKMRIGVWYLSVGLLGLIGLFIALAIVRLIFWIVTIVVAKPGIWIFPNLFADVGFVDSFIPLWAWDVPPPKKKRGEKKKAKREAKEAAAHSHAHDGCCGGAPGGGTTISVADSMIPGGPKIVEIQDGEDED